MSGKNPKALSLPVGLCLSVGLLVLSGTPAPAGAATTALVPSLSVTTSSGPVGSVVVVRESSGCGPQILFGPAGAVQEGSALGYSTVVRYVIPGFVGDPGIAVTAGHYAFAVTCSDPGTASGVTNIVVPFLVTGGPGPSTFVAMAPTPDGHGYWLVQRDGGVIPFGNAPFFGSLPAAKVVPRAPITGIAVTTTGEGYWLVGADGGVFAFGDATFHGSLPGSGVHPVDPVVGIAATGDDGGYWLMGADGGLFTFGDAPFCVDQEVTAASAVTYALGTLLGPDLTVAVAAYPGSAGYATVTDTGGGMVETLPGQPCTAGPGLFLGAEIPLPTFVVGLISAMAVAPHGGPVWLAGTDGGVFGAQLDPEGPDPAGAPPVAPFYGSLPSLGIVPAAPIVGISATPDGKGYWLVGADGGVFAFGDAVFYGSAA